MTDTGPSSAAPRWPRWKGILLVASLALNLLIFGLVAAAGIKHGWGPPPGAQQATLLRFAHTLPSDRKKEIWTTIRPELRLVRPHWRELRKARAEVRTALTAEPFDAARYRQAHDHQLEVELGLRKALHPLFDNVAMLLTPEERRQFVRWQAKAEMPWRKRDRERSNRERSNREDDAGEDAPGGSQGAPASATQPPGGKP